MGKGQVWVLVSEQKGVFLNPGLRSERADGSAIPVAVFFACEQDARDYVQAQTRDKQLQNTDEWTPIKLI